MACSSSDKKVKRETRIRYLSFGLLLLFWSGLSYLVNDAEILPTPIAVLGNIKNLILTGKLWPNLWATSYRVMLAFVLAMTIGSILGYIMGRDQLINAWLDPWLIIFLNIPALIIIVLCLIWIGLNEIAVVTAVTLNKIPLVTAIIREGARASSQALRDLAQVYKLPRFTTMRHIILPELYPSLVAASRAGLSVIWKIVLVVEFLGGSGGKGIGLQIHTQFSIFNVTGVFAYALSFMVLIMIVEFFILQPLEIRATRWRHNAQT